MREVALGLIKKGDKYLVEKFYDEVGKVYFYKLIGGGIEERKTPEEALRREFLEELKSETDILSALKPVEDDFTYKGTKRRIKAHVFEAKFRDEENYDFVQKFIYSPEGKFLSVAMWKTPDEILAEKLDFYPRPLLKKIRGTRKRTGWKKSG